MPLAFDLTWTFVSGSILPVATTERAMSPFSMAASFDESIPLPRGGGHQADDAQIATDPPRRIEPSTACGFLLSTVYIFISPSSLPFRSK